MALAVIIGTLIRANRIIAVVLCWISNPVTLIPLYYGNYWLGGKILGIDLWTFGNFSTRLHDLMLTRERLGYIASLKQLGFETALPLWVGSLIIATMAAILAYPVVLFLLMQRRKRKAGETEDVPDPSVSAVATPSLSVERDEKETVQERRVS